MKVEYGELFEVVTAILFRHDPIEINFEHNTDEYELEAGTILPKLHHCHSAEDVLTVTYEEFVRWFNVERVGPIESYREIAEEIWNHWRKGRPALSRLSSITEEDR